MIQPLLPSLAISFGLLAIQNFATASDPQPGKSGPRLTQVEAGQARAEIVVAKNRPRMATLASNCSTSCRK